VVIHGAEAQGWASPRPNESTKENIALSDLYDLSHPGQYTIQVSRAVSDKPKDGVVKSNTITVTVTE